MEKKFNKVEMKEKKLSLSLFEQLRLHDELPPQEYIYRSITPGSVGYVFGPPKSGKTTYCENLAMSIAFGLKHYFGADIVVKAPQKVLFIAWKEFWLLVVKGKRKQKPGWKFPKD